MPQKTFSRFLAVNRHLIFSDPAGESPQGAFKLRRLEPACTAIHNPVAARRKKADFQLLRRSANRKLCLITVAIRFPRCENRLGRNRKMPNARERVRHRFLLEAALRFICDMPPSAAPALLEHRAVRLYTIRRWGYDLMNPRHCIILFHLNNMCGDGVAQRRIRHKHG